MTFQIVFTETAETIAEMGAETMTEKELVARRGVVRQRRSTRTETSPCRHCGGAGGAPHWPGFTCYRCGGHNSRRFETEQVRYYAPEHAIECDLDRALTELIERRRAEAAIAKQAAADAERLARAWDDALAEDAERVASGSCGRAPGHVGEVGQKVELDARVSFTRHLDGFYGPKMMVVLEASTGDRIVTFGTGASLWDLEKGDAVRIAGKVKEHSEYQGVPQTVLSHARATVAG